MLNIISTCWDILCVDINVDKRCVDHSTSHIPQFGVTDHVDGFSWDLAKENWGRGTHVTRGQNTFHGYEGYFEQILAKIAPVVHFTIDPYLLAVAIL